MQCKPIFGVCYFTKNEDVGVGYKVGEKGLITPTDLREVAWPVGLFSGV